MKLLHSAPTGRFLVLVKKFFNTTLHWENIVFCPWRAFKGVNFGGDTDLSSQHSRNFASDPSW